jgi:transposase
MLDATVVRAHACAAGYGNQEKEGLGRSKGGFTSKVHVKVDALGNVLKILITPGQRHDVTQAKLLLKDTRDANVIADKAYGSAETRDQIKEQNCKDVIPSRSNSKEPVEIDKHLYKERHSVECFFSKMKYFRRVFSRFDKSARNFGSFLSFVGAILWLR